MKAKNFPWKDGCEINIRIQRDLAKRTHVSVVAIMTGKEYTSENDQKEASNLKHTALTMCFHFTKLKVTIE